MVFGAVCFVVIALHSKRVSVVWTGTGPDVSVLHASWCFQSVTVESVSEASANVKQTAECKVDDYSYNFRV